MNKEQVIKNMRDAIEANKHIREQTNNALSHGIGLLEKHDGEYERGAKDAWELARKIVCPPEHCGYIVDENDEIFNTDDHSTIMRNHTFQEALEKLKAYEKKKEEESAKPKLGDVVEVHYEYNGVIDRGVFLAGGELGFTYITTNGTVSTTTYRNDVELTKTGEHVDIQGMLDKIG